MTIAHLQPFLDFIVTWGLCSSRLMGFASASVFFSNQYITGIARNAVVLSLGLLLFPMLQADCQTLLAGNFSWMLCIAMKEVTVGVLLGWLSNCIFYVAQSVGFLIDTQRGASMASMFDPLSNSQTSPLGDFLMKFLMALFLVSGLFVGLMEMVYFSYQPIPFNLTTNPLEHLDFRFFNFQMGTDLLNKILLLGGPVLFILFLSEFGLGLVTRFAPQLNVFFLSMPIKSELAMFFFILYLSYLTRYFTTHFDDNNCAAKFLQLISNL